MDIRVETTYFGSDGEGSDPAILNKPLTQIMDRSSDLRPFFEAAASIFELGVEQQFLSQGQHFGTPWPPLAESTITRRERRVTRSRTVMSRGVRIGRRTGGQHWLPLEGEANFQILSGGPLQESFTRGGNEHVETYAPTSLTWGSAVPNRDGSAPLARIHHFGGGHLPARPIIVLDMMADQVQNALVDHLSVEGITPIRGKQRGFGWGPLT